LGKSGQALQTGTSCPFCGQETNGLELIAAYKKYFNAQYGEHVKRVSSLATSAASIQPLATVGTWDAEHRANLALAASWAAELKLDLAQPDLERLKELLTATKDSLKRAAELKARQPLEPLGETPWRGTSCLSEKQNIGRLQCDGNRS